jgi:hypothetical protein
MTDVTIARLADAEAAGRVMDPLNDLRAPIESLSAPQRVKMFLERQEQQEEQERAAAAYQREAEAEAFTMQTIARQRIEKYVQGHTSEELAEWKRERQQLRDAKIAELEEQLRRLKGLPDPDLPRMQRSANPWREEPVESLLARSKAVGEDPFMRRMVERFDLEQEAARSRRAQAEISRADADARAEAVYGGTITRQCDTEFTTY